MGTANKSTVEGIHAAVKHARELTPQVLVLVLVLMIGTKACILWSESVVHSVRKTCYCPGNFCCSDLVEESWE